MHGRRNRHSFPSAWAPQREQPGRLTANCTLRRSTTRPEKSRRPSSRRVSSSMSCSGFDASRSRRGITRRAIWLQSGGTQIHLMPKPEAAPQSGHVAVIAPGYEETLERLRAGGHEVEARREHWGSPRAYVHDPAGNLVELMAWPPDATEAVPGRGSGE
ncbi:MAG: VOC family protein [Solirubrobacterales bacterium]|nr:VOC family protein [Solirubrobacterales bacterium]